jgi:hypothetical protein
MAFEQQSKDEIREGLISMEDFLVRDLTKLNWSTAYDDEHIRGVFDQLMPVNEMDDSNDARGEEFDNLNDPSLVTDVSYASVNVEHEDAEGELILYAKKIDVFNIVPEFDSYADKYSDGTEWSETKFLFIMTNGSARVEFDLTLEDNGRDMVMTTSIGKVDDLDHPLPNKIGADCYRALLNTIVLYSKSFRRGIVHEVNPDGQMDTKKWKAVFLPLLNSNGRHYEELDNGIYRAKYN